MKKKQKAKKKLTARKTFSGMRLSSGGGGWLPMLLRCESGGGQRKKSRNMFARTHKRVHIYVHTYAECICVAAN